MINAWTKKYSSVNQWIFDHIVLLSFCDEILKTMYADTGGQRAAGERRIKNAGDDDFEEELEEEIVRNRSSTISHMSLGPSSFGMSQPSSIRQADSLPMGKDKTVLTV